jgi:hypothetical protein
MSTYKLIQDIEAEDKILGPLTLRQFIFALIAVFLFYLCWFFFIKHAYVLEILFVPPALFFGFFALPLGRDQPTEVWALAKLRYYFKPRQRVWNQSGVKELVTITAPKKIEPVLTNNLSQGEVTSRLRALADTIDSRGWAVKNVNVNAFSTPVLVGGGDRLLDPSNIPQEVPEVAVTAGDDILDATSNPIAQQFDSMIDQSAKAHRQELVNRLQDTGAAKPPSAQNDYWFMNNAPGKQSTTVPAPEAAKIDPAEEAAVVSDLKARAVLHPKPYGNLRTVQPLSAQPASPAPQAAPPVAPPADPAILSLADNDDLNVSTLAREAKRAKGEDDQNEVVISLR